MGRGSVVPVQAPKPVVIEGGGPGQLRGLPPAPPPPPITIVPPPATTQHLPGASGRDLTISGETGVIPPIYGETQAGSILVCCEEVGNYIYSAFVVCWGEINAINTIKFGDATPAQLGLVLNTDYFVYLGTSGQTRNSMLHTAVPTWIYAYNGTETNSEGGTVPQVAYVVARFKRLTPSTPSADPTRMTCIVQGLKVRDPRTDPTLVTRYYRANPALAAADWKTDDRFGEGEADSVFDWTTVGDAATACDTLCSDGITKRYKIGLSFRTQAEGEANFTAIMAHALLYTVYNEARLKMYADVAPGSWTGAKHYTDDVTEGLGVNIRGDEFPTLHLKAIEEIPSCVEIVYTASGDKWQDKSVFIPNESAPKDNLKTYRLPGCTTRDQAKRTGIQLYNRGRNDKLFTIPISAEWLQTLPGNPITITTRGGLSSTQAIVTDVRARGGGYSGGYAVGFLFDAGAYSDVVQLEDSPISSSVPDPNAVPPMPTSCSVAESRALGSDGKAITRLIVTFTPGNTSFYKYTRITLDRADGNGEMTVGKPPGSPYGIDVPLLGNLHTIKLYTVTFPFDMESLPVTLTITPTYDLGNTLPDPGALVFSSTDGSGMVYFPKPSGTGADMVGGVVAKNLLADGANPPRIASLGIENWPDDVTRQWDLSSAIRGLNDPSLPPTPSNGKQIDVLIQAYSRKVEPTGIPSAFSPGLRMAWSIAAVVTPITRKILASGYGWVRATGPPFTTGSSHGTGLDVDEQSSAVRRSFLTFPTGAHLPSDAVIISAKIVFMCGLASRIGPWASHTPFVVINTSTYAGGAPGNSDFTLLSGVNIGQVAVNFLAAGSAVSVPLSSFSGINLGGDSKYALRSSLDPSAPSDGTEVDIESDETVVSALKPYLLVTYTSATEGAAGAGGGSTVTPFSLAYTVGGTTFTNTAGTYVKAYMGNAPLIPGVDFSVSGTTLTLLTVGGITPANRWSNNDTLWGEVIS